MAEADTQGVCTALGNSATHQLADVTKTVPQLSTISSCWLVHLLQWQPVEAGISRPNHVKNPHDVHTAYLQCDKTKPPQTFVDYDEHPHEYFPNVVTTVLNVHTHVSSLYSSPYDQIQQQLRLTTKTIKERQENELINNPDYSLLTNVDETQCISTLTGAPIPDDLGELIVEARKEPAFFLAHPLAIAASGRECTRRDMPPPIVSLFGSQFLTWHGLPLIPSDKVPIGENGCMKILLLRVDDKRRGVVGLYQPGIAGEQSPDLSVRFMGINQSAVASYLISLYCLLAVLIEGTLAVLEDVEVSKYHDYPDAYK